MKFYWEIYVYYFSSSDIANNVNCEPDIVLLLGTFLIDLP